MLGHSLKMLYIYASLLIVALVASCDPHDTYDNQESSSLVFYPRACETIATLPRDFRREEGKSVLKESENSISTQEFRLTLLTGNDSLRNIVKRYPEISPEEVFWGLQSMSNHAGTVLGIPSLERMMQSEYQSNHRINRAQIDAEGLAFDRAIPWEYRVTGVKDFRIEATTPLFRQPAGTSLNKFFTIHKFHPEQIVSHRSKLVVWGTSSAEKVERIDQWLALKPMAPPAIVFRLNSVPPEVPTRVSFVSILTTTEGKELRDTTTVLLK